MLQEQYSSVMYTSVSIKFLFALFLSQKFQTKILQNVKKLAKMFKFFIFKLKLYKE